MKIRDVIFGAMIALTFVARTQAYEIPNPTTVPSIFVNATPVVKSEVPPQAPPLEQRVSTLEKDVAEIKATLAKCPCVAPHMMTTKKAADGKSYNVVVKADGSCVCQICDENGCKEVPCNCPNMATPTTAVFAPTACSGGNCGVSAGFSVGTPYGAFMGVSDGGGGCANGQCSGSGKRGLFGRRR